MNTRDYQIAARIGEGRKLRDELERLRRENQELRAENASLAAHLELAAVALRELGEMEAGGKLHLVDGWNLILGAHKEAHSRDGLKAKWLEFLAANPADRAWIVFDGPRESIANDGRLRVSYTGGSGAHRADRFINDFCRAARYLGLEGKIQVHSYDKEVGANKKGT